jgi:hypothetical protein
MLSLTSSVRADSVTGTLVANQQWSTYSVSIDGGDSVYAGPTQWNGGSGRLGSNFQTFCVDLSHTISPGGTYTYQVTNPQNLPSIGTGSAGLFKMKLLSELLDNHYYQVGDAPLGSTTFFNNSAALQLAIWDIVFGKDIITPKGDLGLFDTSNGFYVDASSANVGFVQTAATWLNSLTGTASVNPDIIGLDGSQNPNHWAQNQIGVVPAPPSMWLAGIGGLGVLLGARRRRPRV